MAQQESGVARNVLRVAKRNDDAVSPVIAVILMVAITVVLSAAVYVWVTGFGSQGKQNSNLALAQQGSGPRCRSSRNTRGATRARIVRQLARDALSHAKGV